MADTINRFTSSALVEKMRERSDTLSESDAKLAVSRVFDSIKALTDADADVRISGFGTFKRKFREGKQGRNPATGETISIAAKHVLTFKQGKSS